MSLFQLTNQYKALMQKIDDNPDLDPEVVADTVSSIEESMYDKYDHIWTFIKDLEAEASKRDEYVKQSQETSKKLKQKANRLKQYVIQEMNAAGKAKVTTDHYKLTLRHSHRVEITDEKQVPKEFLEAQAPKVKKKEIGQALKDGKEVPGAKYVENQSLTGR